MLLAIDQPSATGGKLRTSMTSVHRAGPQLSEACKPSASTEELLDFKPGSHFFHYTTREAAFEHILLRRELKLSPYFRMRDPLESQPPSLSASMQIGRDLSELERMSRTQTEAEKLIAKVRREAKLLSLTVDDLTYEGADADFGRGYARARMWEQYAENHRGVCLVFDREKLEKLALAQIDERGGKAFSGIVSYTKTGLRDTQAVDLKPPPGISSEQLATDHVARHPGPLFMLKLRTMACTGPGAIA